MSSPNFIIFGARELFLSSVGTLLISAENFKLQKIPSPCNAYRFSKSDFMLQTSLHVSEIRQHLKFKP